MYSYQRISRILLLLALWWPAVGHAIPNPWAFDFDPNIADDPVYVNQHLQELQAGTKKNDAGASQLTTEPPPDSGCSCRAAHGDQGTTGALALVLVMSLLGLTRRRTNRR